jgi:CRP-like cAMP-binding protein
VLGVYGIILLRKKIPAKETYLMNNLSVKLAKAPVFNKLSDADREDLARIAEPGIYQKGESICWQDEIWDKVLYIESGRIDWIMLSPDGKRQIIFRLHAGDVVWGHSIFDEQPMPASLKVISRCKVYQWPGSAVVPIVSRNTEAVWAVSSVLVRSMRHVREVVYGFAFHPVSGRLARLLLSHYQPVDAQSFARDLTLDEMAAIVGSTRELVCKVLYRFADAGMLEITRTKFIFTDTKKLEALASGQQKAHEGASSKK